MTSADMRPRWRGRVCYFWVLVDAADGAHGVVVLVNWLGCRVGGQCSMMMDRDMTSGTDAGGVVWLESRATARVRQPTTCTHTSSLLLSGLAGLDRLGLLLALSSQHGAAHRRNGAP